jgi:hypothetical protein
LLGILPFSAKKLQFIIQKLEVFLYLMPEVAVKAAKMNPTEARSWAYEQMRGEMKT